MAATLRATGLGKFDPSQEGITWVWQSGINAQGMKIRFQSPLSPRTVFIYGVNL